MFRFCAPHELQPGEYGLWNGEWYVRCPGDHPSVMKLTLPHTVQRHDDGTITVSPSMVFRYGKHEYHWFLERGKWRSA